MRHLAAILAFLVMSAACFSAAAKDQPIMPAPDTIRVLAIGNSFSVDAVEQNLYELGMASHTVFVIGNLFIGGCSLQTHAQNAASDAPAYRYFKITGDGQKIVRMQTPISYALADENWDYITMQQRSGFSGEYGTYRPFVENLYRYVRERVPESTRILWHQTWAYEVGAYHEDFARYGNDQQTMYRAIMKASHKVCRFLGLDVIPCGTAVQALRDVYHQDGVTCDGYHMSPHFGRYAVACVWYSILTGKDALGNRYVDPEMTPEQARAAQQAAYLAVRSPYKVKEIPIIAKAEPKF